MTTVTEIYDSLKELERQLATQMRQELLDAIVDIYIATESTDGAEAAEEDVQTWLGDRLSEAPNNWSGGHTISNLFDQVKWEETRKLFREGRHRHRTSHWGRIVAARRR